MNLVISSLFFAPDQSGIAVYAADFARYARAQGHQVEVITGFPFYPGWRKQPADRKRFGRKEHSVEGEIKRSWLYVPRKPTAAKRILHELSFLACALPNFLRLKQPDCIIIFTTPLLLGCVGVLMGKLKGCPVVINVQDFQIEAATSLGMLQDSAALKLLSQLEKMSYQHGHWVTSISPAMVDLLRNKGVPEKQLGYWPNWVDAEKLSRLPKPGAFREKYNIETTTKLLIYSGNIGRKQGLESMVDLAELLIDQQQLQLLIVGDGAAKADLVAYANTKQLSNLRFLPLLEEKEYLQLLTDADASFLPQCPTPDDLYFPSKLLSLAAAGLTLFVAAAPNAELSNIVASNDLGFIADFNQLSDCAEQIEKWLQQGALHRQQQGQTYIQHFARDKVLGEVLDTIQHLQQNR